MVYNLHGLLTLSQAQLMEELPAAPTSPATEEEKKDDGKTEPKSPSKAKDAPAEAGGKPNQQARREPTGHGRCRKTDCGC